MILLIKPLISIPYKEYRQSAANEAIHIIFVLNAVENASRKYKVEQLTPSKTK